MEEACTEAIIYSLSVHLYQNAAFLAEVTANFGPKLTLLQRLMAQARSEQAALLLGTSYYRCGKLLQAFHALQVPRRPLGCC
jgi:hypothetical protein